MKFVGTLQETLMDENRFSLGDLVAHKHYPEKAIGKISKFHNSGRVGVSGDEGTRSFLPNNLILLVACEDSSEVMELSPTPPPTPPVPPVQETEELAEHSENCSQCGSQDIRRFHYHDPNEYYFYCRDCGHEGWRHEKLPPAQVEVEEVEDAIASNVSDDGWLIYSPNDNNDDWPLYGPDDDDNDEDPRRIDYERIGDIIVEELEVEESEDAMATPAEGIAAQADLELLPIPRDFSELKQLPEWWERPILPDFRECSCGEPYDDDDDLDWVQETYGVNATYRGWKLTIYEGGDQIYATPPNSDRLYYCECELDLDGQDGQIAIAQEFIDSWYFAQPSPGQLSLNIPLSVARDPPPHFR